MQHPKAGKVRMPGASLGDRAAQSRVHLPPPMIGEHSRVVLTDFGFSTEEIDLHVASGAVIQN
jgi:crotonobetainyl-CoA:carnitine CoA-transferase CaiB-like acyl-CoA transferase